MALTCKQSAGAVTLVDSVGAAGVSFVGLVIYNADATATSFTLDFVDSSEGNLSITLSKVTVPALSTSAISLPLIILEQNDTLEVTPSAGGGTHHYTYNEGPNAQYSSKAFQITDTTPITIFQNAAHGALVSIFNNKDLLADTPVCTFSDGNLTNIFSKGSLSPQVHRVVALPGSMQAGDSFIAKANSGATSDFHIYSVYRP